MFKHFSGTLPIDCMGIRIGNPLVPREFHNPNPLENRYLPGYIQVQEFCFPLITEKATQSDWAIRGYLQKMSWPQKSIFWIDDQGQDILWVNAHPSEGDCGRDFKMSDAKWMYGWQDKYYTYLIQVTSADLYPRNFPHLTHINMLTQEGKSLGTDSNELYY